MLGGGECLVHNSLMTLTAMEQSENLEYSFLWTLSQIKYQTIWNEGASKLENRILGPFFGINFLTIHHLMSYRQEKNL